MSSIVNGEAQLSWGVNGAGGSGTWDSATPNWFDGTGPVPWANDGSAVFAGTEGTVSISGSVRASAVTFGVPGYVLQGGTLTGGPLGITVRTDADATINSTMASPIFGTGDFTKTGAARLTLAGPLSTFSRVTIESGELDYTGGFINTLVMGYWQNSVLTLSSSSNTPGIGGFSGGGIIQPQAYGGAKTLSFNGAGGSFGGELRNNTTTTLSLLKSSTGVQRLTGANTYSGGTTITGGTLALAENGTAANSAFSISGGTLLLDNSVVWVANRLSDTAPINLFAGGMVFRGHDLAPAAETAGSLVFWSDAASVAVNPTALQPAALTFASLSARSVGHKGLVTFTGAMLGQPPGPGVASIFFQTPPALAGGNDLHPEARIVPGALGLGASGTTFVTYGVNGLRPLGDADYARDFGSVSGWENVDVSAAQSLPTSTAVTALRLRGGANITGSGSLIVRSGVILTQPGEARIAIGALDFGTGEALIANEGNLTIASRVIAANSALGFTKTSAGRLVLAGPSQFGGRIDVFSGVLRLQNATGIGAAANSVNVFSGAAIELAGGVSLTNGSWNLIGDGSGSGGALRSVSGENRIGPVLQNTSSIIDVASGSLTVVGNVSGTYLKKTGSGTLTVTGNVATSQGMAVSGGGALVSTLSSGTPLGSSGITLNGSTLRLAPATAAEILALSIPGTFSYQGGASTLTLDRGTNASLTVTFGSAFARTSPATLLIAPAGGFATLGTTEKVKLNSSSDTAFPMVNGIVATSIIAQDTDADRSGDFLSYTAATGLKRATFSASTNLKTAGSTAIFNATTPQTLIASAEVYALKNSGQTIDLTGGTLTLGNANVSSGCLIFNGGSILGGRLIFAGTSQPRIYTSFAGGTMSSLVSKSSGYGPAELVKFGPGTLTLTGSIQTSVIVESGGLKLLPLAPLSGVTVGGNITLVRGAILSGFGSITGSAAGGLISPGKGVGILTADSTGLTDTKSTGLDESSAATSYAFEFTRTGNPIFNSMAGSGNDLLRLTTGRVHGFDAALSAASEIDIYLDLDGGVQPGDTLRGGFFTDFNASFLDRIDHATFRYFLRDDSGGTLFNGRTYREDAGLPVEIGSVPQAADFGSGNVNGYIMEVRIVPEPSALALLLAASLALLRRVRDPRPAPPAK